MVTDRWGNHSNTRPNSSHIVILVILVMLVIVIIITIIVTIILIVIILMGSALMGPLQK